MWCSSTRRLSQLPRSPILVAGKDVYPASSVRDLGIFIDNDLGAATHVRRTVSRCFTALRQPRHPRRYVTDDCFRLLMVSLNHSRLDYENIRPGRVASLSSATTPVRTQCCGSSGVSSSSIWLYLAILHWLRLPQQVDYKVAVMAIRVLHGLAPPYFNQLVRVADLPGRHRLRSSTSYQLHV